MDPARALARLAFLLPLAGLSALVQPSAVGPFFVLACCLVWARLAAVLGGRRGRDEAILAFETLPFAFWIALRLGRLGLGEAIPVGIAFFLGTAALLFAEDLFLRKVEGPLPALAFCAASFLPALADLALPLEEAALVTAASSALGLVVAGYAAERRRR